MIAVVGTGSWGTTLAIVLTRSGIGASLLVRTPEVAEELRTTRENRRFLPGIPLPDGLLITSLPHEAFAGRQTVMLVVPAQRLRENVAALRAFIPENAVIVSAAKGVEVDSCKRMSEVIREEMGPTSIGRVAALSGPNLSAEVVAGLPTATVVAATDDHVARFVQEQLRIPHLRVYTNSDLVGVELAGALKNIIALGAGICDGLGYGYNAKAAFLTRGIAEIARLGLAMGANPLTFSGLAGFGDLMATCASKLSRNRHVGEQLGRGRPLADIQKSMAQVAEGVPTTIAARQMSRKYRVEMPITDKMYEVLFEGASPREAVGDLMMRDRKGELAGMVLHRKQGRGE